MTPRRPAGCRVALAGGALVLASMAALPTRAAGQGAASVGPAPAKAKSAFVETPDGVKIRYLEAGTGRAILFVPGWTMTAEIWEPQLAHFGKAWRAVAIDPRGQGESGKPEHGLYPAARARDIKAVVDALGLAPVVLVGWSMGVPEVAAFVDQFGTKDLAGVVLVDGIAGSDWDPKVSPGMIMWTGGFLRDRQAQTAAFVRFMYRTPQSEAYLQTITALSLKTPTPTAVALFVGTMTSDLRPALAKIDSRRCSPWRPAAASIPSTRRCARASRACGSRSSTARAMRCSWTSPRGSTRSSRNCSAAPRGSGTRRPRRAAGPAVA